MRRTDTSSFSVADGTSCHIPYMDNACDSVLAHKQLDECGCKIYNSWLTYN